MPAVGRRSRVTNFQPATTEQRREHKPDYWLLVISVLLLAVGLVVVYSISPGLAVEKDVGQSYFIARQLVSVGLGLVAFMVVANIPLSFWQRMLKPLIMVAVVAAVAVRIFGDTINGAHRWIQIGGFSFQPVELIKFAVLIWLAGFLAKRISEGALGDFKRTIRPLLIALGAVMVLVAGLQGDFGSAAVMAAVIGAMTIVAGVPLKRLLAIAGAVIVLAVISIMSVDYRQERLLTFLHPEQDCLNSGYQVCQALIAVGSGGFVGLGLGHSVQAFGYLPEAENDSIFAIFAEKFGFLGVLLLLALFVGLFSRLKTIAERAPDEFSRLIVVGVFTWLTAQSIINIGAMIGLLPLKGITLPLISYGGSSVIFSMAALGLVFHISKYTAFTTPRESLGSASPRGQEPQGRSKAITTRPRRQEAKNE